MASVLLLGCFDAVKVKVSLEQATKTQRGSRDIALLFLQPRRYMGVCGQRQAPATLPPGKTRYPLYKIVYDFRFKALWLAAFHHANPVFLMGTSLLIYTFWSTPTSSRTQQGRKTRSECS